MRPERFGRGANTFNGEVREAVYLGSSLKLGSPATTAWS